MRISARTFLVETKIVKKEKKKDKKGKTTKKGERKKKNQAKYKTGPRATAEYNGFLTKPLFSFTFIDNETKRISADRFKRFLRLLSHLRSRRCYSFIIYFDSIC